jgi:hypothetical protein
MITYTDTSIRVNYADLQHEKRGTKGTMRYRCPIHGGNGYSLSISIEGSYIGTGRCFNAGCPGHEKQVVVPDYPGRQPYHSEKPISADVWARQLLTPRVEPAKSPDTMSHTSEPSPELQAIRSVWPRMQKQVKSNDKALSYLVARGLKPEILDIADMGYIPDVSLTKTGIPEKWRDRLVVPLTLPNGQGGYVGRALWGWEQGQDEHAHKLILDAYDDECTKQDKRNLHRRWEKTVGIAGWYGPSADDLADTIFIVEGSFDRLALLTSGIAPNEVIAAIGTAIPADWIPPHVERVILALDGDGPGQKRASELEQQLKVMGIAIVIATAPDDGLGKDASERYRMAGNDGIEYLIDAWVEITSM